MMKIKVHASDKGTIMGIQYNQDDQLIANSLYFILMLTDCGMDQRTKEQTATAIMMNKPMVLMIMKGVECPQEIRDKANVVFEFEFTKDNPDTIEVGLTEFFQTVYPKLVEERKERERCIKKE